MCLGHNNEISKEDLCKECTRALFIYSSQIHLIVSMHIYK